MTVPVAREDFLRGITPLPAGTRCENCRGTGAGRMSERWWNYWPKGQEDHGCFDCNGTGVDPLSEERA